MITKINNWSLSSTTFDWIRANLKEGSTILELGSGLGTVELSKFYDVVSVEHDEKYIIPGKNRQYIHAPIVDYKNYRWYDKNILLKHLPAKYDLLLIDGPTGDIGRFGIFYNNWLFNWDCIVIVDDTNREIEKFLSDMIRENLMNFTQFFQKEQINSNDRFTDIYYKGKL